MIPLCQLFIGILSKKRREKKKLISSPPLDMPVDKTLIFRLQVCTSNRSDPTGDQGMEDAADPGRNHFQQPVLVRALDGCLWSSAET